MLIKALRVNTLSKLTHSDTSAFNALIGDVFPGANPDPNPNPNPNPNQGEQWEGLKSGDAWTARAHFSHHVVPWAKRARTYHHCKVHA